MDAQPDRPHAARWTSRLERWAPHYRFDRWAPQYDASLLQPLLFGPTHLAVLDAASIAGARPRDVLDLGCGTGLLLDAAGKRWPEARLVGIDLSSQMVSEARRHHAGDGRFRFEVGDAAACPLEPASIDLTFSTISFHHWANQGGGLREAARILRPGGLFVLADIRPPWLLRPIMRSFHETGARLRLFEQAGLTVVHELRPARLGGFVLVTIGRRG